MHAPQSPIAQLPLLLYINRLPHLLCLSHNRRQSLLYLSCSPLVLLCLLLYCQSLSHCCSSMLVAHHISSAIVTVTSHRSSASITVLRHYSIPKSLVAQPPLLLCISRLPYLLCFSHSLRPSFLYLSHSPPMLLCSSVIGCSVTIAPLCQSPVVSPLPQLQSLVIAPLPQLQPSLLYGFV